MSSVYVQYLERPPAAAEVEFHVNRLLAGATLADLQADFIGSPEFQSRAHATAR